MCVTEGRCVVQCNIAVPDDWSRAAQVGVQLPLMKQHCLIKGGFLFVFFNS